MHLQQFTSKEQTTVKNAKRSQRNTSKFNLSSELHRICPKSIGLERSRIGHEPIEKQSALHALLVSCPSDSASGLARVYPHANAWRLRIQPEPPCVSMRVDAKDLDIEMAGTAY